ncbi:MAG TPA: MgtC/SapB family protein [Azonexus sp.]|jgi:uncharacterized membrane protein YhiD involved in acid resistance|nr:MgtC/SapB family protein [Azonexus sp.]
MSFVAPELAAPVEAFATALGIGLLVGMERERRPDSAAGLRTFALVSMLGCLFALLREKTGGPWALMANLVFKIGLVIGIGGSKLARHALPGLIAIGTGMALGLLLF